MVSEPPRVLIVEPQAYDYSAAEVYGKLHVLRTERLAPNAPDDSVNTRVVGQLRTQMRDLYRPGTDFVVPTGKPALIMLVGMLMTEIVPETMSHNILGWDARTQRYLVYRIPA